MTYFRAPLVGGLGGLLAFLLGQLGDHGPSSSIIGSVVSMGFWSALFGVGMGSVILAYDNLQSLRGRWSRDLLPGALLFALLGLCGGAAGQIAYLGTQNSLTRGLGWALMGTGVGLGIGMLRRDLGGALGGFIGGFIFNSLAVIATSSDGTLSRAVGLMITGAMIALFMRVVQETLKDAWLVGLSPGPYRGKEYPLNTERVTVGRSELNSISLYRESELAMQSGAFVFENGHWMWRGEPAEINGELRTEAPLHPGTRIKLGATEFLFQGRAARPH